MSLIVDKHYELVTLDGIREVLETLKYSPVLIDVDNDMFPSVEILLRKNLVIYTIISFLKNNKKIRLLLLYPEHVLKTDKRLNEKSYLLSDPDVVTYLFKISDFLKNVYVNSPIALVKAMYDVCKYGYRFLFLTSTKLPARAFITCMCRKILAIVYENTDVEIGNRALRKLFYYGPYNIMVYSIDVGHLEKRT